MPVSRRRPLGPKLLRVQSRSGAEYHRRLQAALEQRARSMGEFLHDEAGQLLTAAYIALAEAAEDLPPRASERLKVVQGHLASPTPGRIRCIIRDNGVGFDVHTVTRRNGVALGLRGIRDRLQTVGGGLTIKSAFGAGTELIATVPLDA